MRQSVHAFGSRFCDDAASRRAHQRGVELTGPGDVFGSRNHCIAHDPQRARVAVVEALERREARERERRLAQRHREDGNPAAVDAERQVAGRRAVKARAEGKDLPLRRVARSR